MSGLFGSMIQWWEGRTVREQRMLMVMGVAVAAMLVWLVIVRPAFAWRSAAADRRETAVSTLVEVRSALAALQPAQTTASPPPQGLESLVRQAAEANGLDLTTSMSASGDLGFRLARADSRTLFAWLSALETDQHLTICGLGVAENADATLNVEGALTSGTCG